MEPSIDPKKDTRFYHESRNDKGGCCLVQPQLGKHIRRLGVFAALCMSLDDWESTISS